MTVGIFAQWQNRIKKLFNARNCHYLLKRISILALYAVIGGLIGYISYGYKDVARVGYSVFLLLLFCVAKNRIEIFVAAFLYYLTVSRHLPNASIIFFAGQHSYSLGVFVWGVYAYCLALPYGLFHFRKNNLFRNTLGLFLVFLSITLLPLGIIGFASPFNSAGIFFRNTHFIGFFLLILSVVLVAEILKYIQDFETSIFIKIFFQVILISFICLLPTRLFVMPQEPEIVEAVNTHLGRNRTGINQLKDLVGQRISKAKKPYMLFPESSVGVWLRRVKYNSLLWNVVGHTAQRAKKTLIFGAEIIDGGKYNCLVMIGIDTQNGQAYFEQRVPMPISMWKPWSKEGFKANFFADGILELPSHHISCMYLICYEQVIPWCFLRSMCVDRTRCPSIVLASSNLWWASKTNFPNSQMQTLYSLASLFGLDVAYAVNR